MGNYEKKLENKTMSRKTEDGKREYGGSRERHGDVGKGGQYFVTYTKDPSLHMRTCDKTNRIHTGNGN